MTRVVFLGTPGHAVTVLEELHARFDVVLAICRPDKPVGRSASPQPPPVKIAADEMGIDVRQPERAEELSAALREQAPFDAGVVVAYGVILRPEALLTAAKGFLNVHFSLLPRWRGAAPVARALMAGDMMTGVTIIELDEGLDTGPVLTAQAVDIGPEETAGELTERLARLGARLLSNSLPGYLEGSLRPVPQTDEGVTYASKLGDDDRRIEPTMPVTTMVNRVRGLSPSPGATLDIDGTRHRVLRARPHTDSPPAGRWTLLDGRPVVGAADGGVELIELQPAGKRVMSGAEWARGRHAASGTVA